MSQRLDGVRGENCSRVVFAPFILQKSRMRRRARTDLCGGRLVRVVPTATIIKASLKGPLLQERVRQQQTKTSSGRII